PAKAELMDRMTAYFRPEFLARLSDIVPFAPISYNHLIHIFRIQLMSLELALDQQGIQIQVHEDAVAMLATSGFNPKYGARQLATVIRNELKRPLSKLIVSGKLKKGQTVSVKRSLDQETILWNITD